MIIIIMKPLNKPLTSNIELSENSKLAIQIGILPDGCGCFSTQKLWRVAV